MLFLWLLFFLCYLSFYCFLHVVPCVVEEDFFEITIVSCGP